MSGAFKILFFMMIAGFGVFLVGPRPGYYTSATFDPDVIPQDVDAYVKAEEQALPGIRDGLQKEIVWYGQTEVKTDWSIVYLHGFSASKRDIAPVPRKVAAGLEANLFLTRFAGHGMDGDALANVTSLDWLNDTVEAIEIGKRIGDKVLVIGTSTGATLATWAASQSDLAQSIHGLVLMSPNYGVHGASTGLLNMPWAEEFLPLIFGEERSFEPLNADHAAGWTTRYPSRTIFPMASILRLSDSFRFSAINTPALFIYSKQDAVVLPSEIDDAVEDWGGPAESMIIRNSGDPANHVIAGDALSPEQTAPVVGRILAWVAKIDR